MEEEIKYKNSNLSVENSDKLFNWTCIESLKQCSFPMAYRDKSFSNLEGDYQDIIKKLEAWDFQTPLICSLLSVQNGIGKTHIAMAMFKQYIKIKQKLLLEYNIKAYNEQKECEHPSMAREFKFTTGLEFVSARRILLEVRDTYDKKKSELDIVDSYSEIPLLVIDDIFSSKEKGDRDFERRILLDILDRRTDYNIKPTILTGNLTLDEIANIDTRIASRLNNKMLIQITKKLTDYRTKL